MNSAFERPLRLGWCPVRSPRLRARPCGLLSAGFLVPFESRQLAPTDAADRRTPPPIARASSVFGNAANILMTAGQKFSCDPANSRLPPSYFRSLHSAGIRESLWKKSAPRRTRQQSHDVPRVHSGGANQGGRIHPLENHQRADGPFRRESNSPPASSKLMLTPGSGTVATRKPRLWFSNVGSTPAPVVARRVISS